MVDSTIHTALGISGSQVGLYWVFSYIVWFMFMCRSIANATFIIALQARQTRAPLPRFSTPLSPLFRCPTPPLPGHSQTLYLLFLIPPLALLLSPTLHSLVPPFPHFITPPLSHYATLAFFHSPTPPLPLSRPPLYHFPNQQYYS